MLIASLGLFAVAALFGLYMIANVFKGALPPWSAAILHGLFAATGLVILLYATVTAPQSGIVIIGAGLLVVAALGGFIMISFHLRKIAPPKALAAIHALAAVAGAAALAASAFGFA
jgi:hypothetical protein